MTTSALRPRSVTEIVDAVFQIFRSHFGPMVMGSAIAYVPALVMQLVMLQGAGAFSGGEATLTPAFGTFWFVSMLVSIVSFAIMTALLTVLTSQAYLGEPVDLSVALRRALPRAAPAVAAGVIASIATGIGFILLIVPGIFLALHFFAVTPAAVLEGLGPTAALARSGDLSKGRKMTIFLTFLLVIVIYFVIFMGVGLVSAIAGGIVVQTLINALLTVTLYPVFAITVVLLYYDARVQSEGLDIELMAGALDAPPNPLTT
jgi:hypothetical protein